jgi:hypothetical protein
VAGRRGSNHFESAEGEYKGGTGNLAKLGRPFCNNNLVGDVRGCIEAKD